jgi:hypothetical protein
MAPPKSPPQSVDNATIYSYRLVRKIAFGPLGMAAYWGAFVAYCLVELLNKPAELALIPLGFVLISTIHSLVIAIDFAARKERLRGLWVWTWQPPWIGLLPKQHTSAALMNRLHWQLLWVGLALIGCGFPWIPFSLFLQWLFLHCWIVVPRIAVLQALPSAEGLIKIGRRETSYYMG